MKSRLSHQDEAMGHLAQWRVGALFMEAGTGKTRVAVDITNSIADIGLVLWVGPLRTINPTIPETTSVKDEIEKWGGFKCPVCYFGVESIQSSDRIYMNMMDCIRTAKNVMMIVDESLKIKNANAKRTRRIIRAGKLVRYKLILNGTPISKNILDIYTQMEFLSPDILNMSYSQFKNTFCNYTTILKNRKVVGEYITGYENIDYLYSLIRHYVYECDLSLNVTQNYHTIYYKIDSIAKSQYEEIKELYLNLDTLQEKNNNIFIEMTQKMQHSYCCTPSKFDVLDDLFLHIDKNKTIIYCKYISSREACEKRYPGAMVCSYQKESLGLNLQDYNHTVYFDKIWDYALRIQAGRRTYRTGQRFDCQYWDMTGDVGLEKLIDKNIDKKINMVEYFKNKSKDDIAKDL